MLLLYHLHTASGWLCHYACVAACVDVHCGSPYLIMKATVFCAGLMTDAGLPFYLSVACAAGHLAWQIRAVDLNSRADCMAKFVSNRDFGAILFSGIVLDKLCQQPIG